MKISQHELSQAAEYRQNVIKRVNTARQRIQHYLTELDVVTQYIEEDRFPNEGISKSLGENINDLLYEVNVIREEVTYLQLKN